MINYAFNDANQKPQDYQSFYTLNFLQHKLNLNSNFAFANRINVNLNYTFKQRAGNYQLDSGSPLIPYDPIHLIDTRISWQKANLLVYVDSNNLFNYSYYEFGFVEQPGRWLTTGLTINF